MAASRVRCGLSLCSRLARSRCATNSKSLLLDTYKLGKPLSAVVTTDFASIASKKVRSQQFSTSSVVAVLASTNSMVPEDPGSRPSSVGGGVSVTENEDDDDPFIREQIKRYNRFRRWLAMIMGENVETFTDKDVQEAIEYLMPSSLFAKDARPQLMHPYEMYKKQKGQLFDNSGRPLAAGFYTGRVGYHDLLFDIYTQFERLEEAEQTQNSSYNTSLPTKENEKSKEHEKHIERPHRWIKKIELEHRLDKTLQDREYEVVLHRLKKLAAHPNASTIWDFLNKFIFPVATPGIKQVELQLDEEGRAHGTGHRKRAIAEVWIKKGSGQITVNDQPLVQYFTRIEDRQQILFPFHVIDGAGRYDAECNVIGGGPTGQSGAIRLAISRALLNFSVDYQSLLLDAGLLIRDPRIVERKKPGQKKARKKFAWVKR